MRINTSKTHLILFSIIKCIMLISLLLSAHFTNASDISEEIKSYISSIKSLAVEFTQEDSTGRLAQGMLIIQKPYKFRCNYYEPFPIVIVGNKNYVSVYDYEMGHLSRIKAEENIFNFLLVDKVSFDNQFEILSAKELNNSYVLRLKNHDLNKISEIWFDKKNRNIQKMQIFEENNSITLTFGQTMQISNIANTLFMMKDPEVFGTPDRFNKAELEKQFKKL
ncbi:MAG: outer membrane lipoprotein carrier protein LolA [Rickettsiaceae bacterium]|nr:outer membrane lipoprotein carrier protein LolA [Rickettsiaceae bacterium]